MEVFELCPNEQCYDGELIHYGKRDVWHRGECPDCGGTGKVVIADKEKAALLAFIIEIASTPINFVNEDKPSTRIIIKAQKFLKQLPNEYSK